MAKLTYGRYRDSDSLRKKGRKKKVNAVRNVMRISDKLVDYIEDHKKPNERPSDTLERLIFDFKVSYGDLRKKFDALLVERQQGSNRKPVLLLTNQKELNEPLQVEVRSQ
jgi:hypothetical protein